MQHLDEGTIHSWLDGALGAEEAARAEAHVAECPQCAAAVAEARGFIAGSSRILTALDHVPRRVVPAVPPVKWHNRAVWRAAATVLVVAMGSLVVVRNSEYKARVAPPMLDSARVSEAAVAQPQIVAPSPAATATHKIQPITPITPSTKRAISSGATLSGKPTAEADFSRRPTGGAAPPNTVGRERALKNEAAATGGYAGAPSQIAGALIVTPQAAAPSRVAGVTALDVASEQLPLKVVGAPRTIGAKATLYETAPGDTVTLTELMNVQLQSVVTTGITSAAPRVGKSAPLPAERVEVVNGVTTITWRDITTGNTLKLSGRVPPAQLQEIKLRIERERAAAAAAKKRP